MYILCNDTMKIEHLNKFLQIFVSLNSIYVHTIIGGTVQVWTSKPPKLNKSPFHDHVFHFLYLRRQLEQLRLQMFVFIMQSSISGRILNVRVDGRRMPRIFAPHYRKIRWRRRTFGLFHREVRGNMRVLCCGGGINFSRLLSVGWVHLVRVVVSLCWIVSMEMLISARRPHFLTVCWHRLWRVRRRRISSAIWRRPMRCAWNIHWIV